MSSGTPPFSPMEPPGGPFNPYASPQFAEPVLSGAPLVEAVKRKVQPPAYFLCAVGGLGMFSSILIVILSIGLRVMQPPGNADDATVEALDLMFDPDAAAFQVLFFFVHLTVLVGGYQMSQVKLRPMAFVASILAMINCGSLCCVLGLPAGIWSLVVLCQSDVARAFEENY